MATRIFVNGKEVSKEDIAQMEIKIDEVKRIIAEKVFTNQEEPEKES